MTNDQKPVGGAESSVASDVDHSGSSESTANPTGHADLCRELKRLQRMLFEDGRALDDVDEYKALYQAIRDAKAAIEQLSQGRDELETAYNVRNDEVTGLQGQLAELRADNERLREALEEIVYRNDSDDNEVWCIRCSKWIEPKTGMCHDEYCPECNEELSYRCLCDGFFAIAKAALKEGE